MGTLSNRKSITFQDAVTGTENGEEVSLINFSQQMLLDIQTDATTLTVIFEAQGLNENWIAVTGYNYTTALSATETIAHINELWQIELTGMKKIRARISVQTGGTGTTIKGMVVG